MVAQYVVDGLVWNCRMVNRQEVSADRLAGVADDHSIHRIGTSVSFVEILEKTNSLFLLRTDAMSAEIVDIMPGIVGNKAEVGVGK